MTTLIPPPGEVQLTPPPRARQSLVQRVLAKALPALVPLVACLYVGLVIFLPALNVVLQAFAKGAEVFLQSLQDQDMLAALRLTLFIAAIAVPANSIFGLAAATAIARKQFRGKALLLSVIDLPFSISPVVVGLMLVLLFSPTHGLLEALVNSTGWKIIFSWPGMVLATIIVSFPFMAREVIPLLEEEGWEEEEAAKTLGATDWQVFWKVTLPMVRWAALYGLILTTAYKQYHTELAYGAALILAAVAIVSLFLKFLVERLLEQAKRAARED
jgi:sulfate transport system permease protein